jgi:hypothetical protein
MPPKFYRLVLLVLVTIATASVRAQQLTFDQLAKASKIYFRDTAEFPMRMSLEFTALDANGRIRKHKTGRFDYDFHGYNPRSEKADLNMRGPKSALKAGITAGIAVLLPVSVLANKAEEGYHFAVAEGNAPELLSAKLIPLETCRPATWSNDSYFLNQFCGPSVFEVTRTGFELKHYHFDAAGLPVQAKVDYLGRATVNNMFVDADFQQVQIPSDPKPFLVPKKVVLTIETDKGKLLMTGDFVPKTSKK